MIQIALVVASIVFTVSICCALIEMQALYKKTGKMVTMIAGEIQAGGMFGELALMKKSNHHQL